MIRVAFILRSTIFTVQGGDTVQAVQTVTQLRMLGVHAEIVTCGQAVNDDDYDVLHFFNLFRPADILAYTLKSRLPYVVSPIWVDYSEYDKYHRKGVSGMLFRSLSSDAIEYCKTVARWVLGKDKLHTKRFLWKGQRWCIQEILRGASMLLPNSHSEIGRLSARFEHEIAYEKICNGIDPDLFRAHPGTSKDKRMVLCVARVEGMKNQLNLIRALNGTAYRLFIIGSAAPNQQPYYRMCKKIAKNNIFFLPHLPQEELLQYYAAAAVHVLPSWFETTGLSSLEAVAMGCNAVVSKKGDTEEYFGPHAWYCDPADPASIFSAVEKAASSIQQNEFKTYVLQELNWRNAAAGTLNAYRKVLAV